MPNFSIVNNANEAHAVGTWSESATFNHKNQMVDSQGNYVSETYAGTKYRLISKQEHDFSCLERGARSFVGVAAVICSLGLALLSTAVMELFTKQKEIIRFGVLVPPFTQLNNQITCSTTNPLPEIPPEPLSLIQEPTHQIAPPNGRETAHSHQPVIAIEEQTFQTAQAVETVSQQIILPLSLQDELLPALEPNLPEEVEEVLPWEEIRLLPHDQMAGSDQEELEKFKKNLADFCVYDSDKGYAKKSPQKIAVELFKIAPKNLALEEIVNLVFETYSGRNIPHLLEAILVTQPSFALSPYDEIRSAIASDEEHTITNALFMSMLQERWLDTDENKITACYDLAYRLNHPYIYRLSDTPILPTDYTLNFLWVNLNPQDRNQNTAENIFKDGLDLYENADCITDTNALRAYEAIEQSMSEGELENWTRIKATFAYRISKWADVNPNAQINLWYDSALVTQKAQQKTFEMMNTISQSRGVNLQLRDIRQLPNIEGEIKYSLHPGTQLYYRVDILKALIADYMISSPAESAKYCVVSDIDVESMPPQQLFDQRTVSYLSSNGYAFNRVSLLGNFENSFFIFNREKENLQKIHHKTMIQGTASNIALLRNSPKGAGITSDYALNAQFVFKQYFNFRRKMNESYKSFLAPRKVVKCPPSQFDGGGSFPKSDFKAEIFRFIGASNIPYTINGRNSGGNHEDQIPALINWTAEPLGAPV